MSPEDMDEWLDSWVESHLAHGDFTLEAAVALCTQDSTAAGISAEALRQLSGGDLAAFLADELKAIREAGSTI